jgi:hypothetical protein
VRPVVTAVAPVGEAVVGPVASPVRPVVTAVAPIGEAVAAPVARLLGPVVSSAGGSLGPVASPVRPLLSAVAPIGETVVGPVASPVRPLLSAVAPIGDAVGAPVTRLLGPVVSSLHPLGAPADLAPPPGSAEASTEGHRPSGRAPLLAEAGAGGGTSTRPGPALVPSNVVNRGGAGALRAPPPQPAGGSAGDHPPSTPLAASADGGTTPTPTPARAGHALDRPLLAPGPDGTAAPVAAGLGPAARVAAGLGGAARVTASPGPAPIRTHASSAGAAVGGSTIRSLAAPPGATPASATSASTRASSPRPADQPGGPLAAPPGVGLAGGAGSAPFGGGAALLVTLIVLTAPEAVRRLPSLPAALRPVLLVALLERPG